MISKEKMGEKQMINESALSEQRGALCEGTAASQTGTRVASAPAAV